jgi:hypothetical protein
MSDRLKRLAAVVAVVGLAACAAAGITFAVRKLPGLLDPPPDLHEDGGWVTWLGQGVPAAWTLAFLLLVVIYAAKWGVGYVAPGRQMAVALYGLIVACSLPYIWFLVVVDWKNPFVFRFSCWLYYPVGVWLVPTASFAWDTAKGHPPSRGAYLLRSAIEIGIVFPVWAQMWAWVSFFLLGGGWI